MERPRRFDVLALGLLVLLSGPALAVERYAVLVGNNQGQDFRRRLRFAEDDAERLQQVLTELGGFDAAHTRLLQGRRSEEVRNALLDLESRLAEHKVRGESTVLLFFYSGHADGDALELGDSAFRFDELVQLLKASSATVRIAIVDSCQSGRLVASKGVRRGPSYPLVTMDGDLRSSGYAVLTSSAGDEASQESREIRGSFFTNALVSGLRGAADRSGDGQVTVDEAYAYAYARTVARTSSGLAGAQHPLYEFQLKGRGDVVLTQAKAARARLVVRSAPAGRLMVLTPARDRALAEAEVGAGQAVSLALSPGEYVAFFVSGDEVRRADVRLVEASPLELDSQRDFAKESLTRGVAKGGLFRTSWSGEVGLGVAARRFPLGEQLASFGGELSAHLLHPDGAFLVARLSGLGAPDVGVATGFHDLGLTVGGGYRLTWTHLELRGALGLGVDYTGLAPRDGQRRASLGPSWSGELELTMPLASNLLLSVGGGAGGRLLFLRGSGLTHQLDARAHLAVGTTWE